MPQPLDYGLRPGSPSGWGYAVFSTVLGFIGIVATAYTLVVVFDSPRLPQWALSWQLALPGCAFCFLAPAGLFAGALVTDERRDVARLAQVGMLLNTVAFAMAVMATCTGVRFLSFD